MFNSQGCTYATLSHIITVLYLLSCANTEWEKRGTKIMRFRTFGSIKQLTRMSFKNISWRWNVIMSHSFSFNCNLPVRLLISHDNKSRICVCRPCPWTCLPPVVTSVSSLLNTPDLNAAEQKVTGAEKAHIAYDTTQGAEWDTKTRKATLYQCQSKPCNVHIYCYKIA